MLWRIVMSLAHVRDSVDFAVYEAALLPTCPPGANVLSFAYCAVSLQLSPSLRYLLFLFSCRRVCLLSFVFCAVKLYLSPLLRYLLFLFSCSMVCSLSTHCLPLVYPLFPPCLPIVYPLPTPCLPIVYPLPNPCLPLA